MKEENQNQFVDEPTSWQNRLEFLRQENALLKYRLSEMVDYSDEKDFLLKAEYFQNELLLKDDALDKLIKELKNFPGKINGQNVNKSLEEIYNHDKLRSNMVLLEEEFLQLSDEFNREMLKNSKP